MRGKWQSDIVQIVSEHSVAGHGVGGHDVDDYCRLLQSCAGRGDIGHNIALMSQ